MVATKRVRSVGDWIAGFVSERPAVSVRKSARAAKKGPSSVTPVSNPHIIFGGGSEDTVELSVWLEWVGEIRTERFFEKCVCRREALIRGKKSSQSEVVELAPGHVYEQVGKGHHSGLFFPIHFKREGVTIYLRCVASPEKHAMNCQVHLGSLALMMTGGLGPWLDRLKEWFQALGAYVKDWKLTRVDPSCDFYSVGQGAEEDVECQIVDEITDDYLAGRVITRASAWADYDRQAVEVDHRGALYGRRGRRQGVWIGKRTGIRVYDKEYESRRDPIKRAWLIENRWGGQVRKRAARVEFQLDRRSLKTFGIDTPEDWIAKRGQVVSYMCRDWFKIVDRVPDGKNYERPQATEAWETISKSFDKAFGGGESAVRTFVRKVDVKQLSVQAVGCITSMVALTGGALWYGAATAQDFYQAFVSQFKEILGDGFDAICCKAIAKRRSLEARIAVTLPGG